MNNGSLVELPKKGKVMIITDIHGNLDDFKIFMDIWKDLKNENNHLIITGDFIQSTNLQNDRTIEIIETLKHNFQNFDNFHVLLGNHEWSEITNTNIYKAGANLSLNYEILLKEHFKNWKEKRKIYKDFFKSLPIAARTQNKVFISHSGPSKFIKNIDDIINITSSGYMDNKGLFDLLWNRYGDYDKEDIQIFLKNVGCNAFIVGHTPVKGAQLIDNKQLIISSSYSAGKKAYVELDLEREIKNGKDVFKMVKYLD